MSEKQQKTKIKTKPFARTLSQYEFFLREICGLKPNTVAQHISYCVKFFQHIQRSNVVRIRSINQDVVVNFIVSESKIYARKGRAE